MPSKETIDGHGAKAFKYVLRACGWLKPCAGLHAPYIVGIIKPWRRVDSARAAYHIHRREEAK